jgi:hypothetical protein
MNPSILNLYMFWVKIICIFLHIKWDTAKDNEYTYLICIHLLKGLTLYYFAVRKFPYHQKNVSKTNGIFASCYLWNNIIFFIL